MANVSRAGAVERNLELQRRLWDARHSSISGRQGRQATGRRLFREIQRYLIKAADSRLLEGGQAGVHQRLRAAPLKEGIFEIAVGDERNFRRDPSLPHFRRCKDGAWFDFQMQLREHPQGFDIVQYDFELRIPSSDSVCSTFVRFDLNPPGHDNEDDGLRSHMHVNSDDDGMAVPAPVMSPFELLDIMVHGLIRTGRIRRRESMPAAML